MESTKISPYGLCLEYLEHLGDYFMMKYDGVAEVESHMNNMILVYSLVYHLTRNSSIAVSAALECSSIIDNFQDDEIAEACDYARTVMDNDE